MKAYLKNYRQSPRKVRLLADLVRGKGVEKAIVLLQHTPKRATHTITKLLSSASANALHNSKVQKKDLYIKSIRVDEGPTLKRIRLVSRGSAHPIRKRTSNIILELAEKRRPEKQTKKNEVSKTSEKKEAGKVVSKASNKNPKKNVVKK